MGWPHGWWWSSAWFTEIVNSVKSCRFYVFWHEQLQWIKMTMFFYLSESGTLLQTHGTLKTKVKGSLGPSEKKLCWKPWIILYFKWFFSVCRILVQVLFNMNIAEINLEIEWNGVILHIKYPKLLTSAFQPSAFIIC